MLTFFTSVSRSESSSTKWVGTPCFSKSCIIMFDMRLLTTPFPTIVPFFAPLNAVASSLYETMHKSAFAVAYTFFALPS